MYYRLKQTANEVQANLNRVNNITSVYTKELPEKPISGDLFIPNKDIYIDEILYQANKIYKYDDTYDEWVAILYADNTELDSFKNEYQNFVKGIQEQVDGQAQTWYTDYDPSIKKWVVKNEDGTVNTTETQKNYELHVGDLWKYTGANDLKINNQTTTAKSYSEWIWREEENGTYGWKEMKVPNEVFDKIDGKSSIYIEIPKNSQPEVNDLLIPAENIKDNNDVILYKKGNVYKYNGSSWVEINYPDNEYMENVRVALESNIKSLSTDLSTNIGDLDDAVGQYLGLGGKVTMGSDYIISPYIGGGYLNITGGGGTQVTINPQKLGNNIADRTVFRIKKGGETVIGFDDDGNAKFNGNITAKSLTLSDSSKETVQNEVIPALNPFFDGDFKDYVKKIKTQTDKKAETWYLHYDPSPDWEDKALHVGDLWKYTGSSDLQINNDTTTAKPNSEWIWQKKDNNSTSYEWKEMKVPDEVFDKIDGKSQIFVTRPEPPYFEGDMWILERDYQVDKVYAAGTILTAIRDSDNGYAFDDWKETVKYGIDLENYRKQLQDKIDDLSGNLNDNKDELDKVVNKYLGSDGVTMVGEQYVISPYIAGGYLNITNGKTSVIINPLGNGNAKNAVFRIEKDDNVVMGVDSNGNATFSGDIEAKSLTLLPNVKIGTNNINGLSTIATSGNYNDLSNKPTIPTSVTQLTGGANILHTDDVSIGSTTTSDGVTKQTITVGGKSYTSITTGDFVLTNVGLGTNTSDGSKQYTCISKDGLLTAKNAIIYGTVHASSGEIGGFTLKDNKLSSSANIEVYPTDFDAMRVLKQAKKGSNDADILTEDEKTYFNFDTTTTGITEEDAVKVLQASFDHSKIPTDKSTTGTASVILNTTDPENIIKASSTTPWGKTVETVIGTGKIKVSQIIADSVIVAGQRIGTDLLYDGVLSLDSTTGNPSTVSFKFEDYRALYVIGVVATTNRDVYAKSSIYIPKDMIVKKGTTSTKTSSGRFQIADEAYYLSFKIEYDEENKAIILTIDSATKGVKGQIERIYGIG